MKRWMLAPVLVMGGALTTIGVAAGEDRPAAGACSLETGGTPMMVASAASTAAASAKAMPAIESASAVETPASATVSLASSEESTSPPGSCGVPERFDPKAASLAVAAETPVTETASSSDVAAPEPAKPVEVAMAAPAQAEVAPVSEVTPVPAPAKKPARPRAAAKRPSPPGSDRAALAWWPAKVDDALNLVFAGEASFTPAIALLFDGAFDNPALANKVIRVTSANGTPVAGQWVVATNKRMLLFKARPGRYQVKVGGELADSTGRKIAAAQGGPVDVATR